MCIAFAKVTIDIKKIRAITIMLLTMLQQMGVQGILSSDHAIMAVIFFFKHFCNSGL